MLLLQISFTWISSFFFSFDGGGGDDDCRFETNLGVNAPWICKYPDSLENGDVGGGSCGNTDRKGKGLDGCCCRGGGGSGNEHDDGDAVDVVMFDFGLTLLIVVEVVFVSTVTTVSWYTAVDFIRYVEW